MVGPPTRRRFLATVGATAGVSTVGRPATLVAAADDQEGPALGLEPVASGMAAPVGVAFPDGVELGFVADQAGQVWALDGEGRRTEPFLDLTDRIVDLDGYTERGLLGVAFHPDYADNGRLFVRYSAPNRPGTPSDYSHTFVLSEFGAEGDPTRATSADPGSERTVLEIPQPQGNHNAGSLAFGPDGYLYVGVGDGGGANDQGSGHVTDWYDAVEGGNGQDVTENLLGSILRIDVDDATDQRSRDGEEPARNYGIPADNPLVGRAGLDEHYAWGLRNPWGLSFDGDRLFVADVGQGSFEEVDVVERGGNYGWNVREASHCFAAEDCPDETPGGDPLIDPILEYPHEGDGEAVGVAVVGGYVYRGDAIPTLDGDYVFGDWKTSFSTRRTSLFVGSPPDGEADSWSLSTVPVGGEDGDDRDRFLLGFGRDGDGELYVCTSGRPTVGGSSGAVHRVVPEEDDGAGTTSGRDRTDEVGTDDRVETGDGTTEGTGRSDGQPTPGYGVLAGILGIAGAVVAGWRERRRDDDA